MIGAFIQFIAQIVICALLGALLAELVMNYAAWQKWGPNE